MSLLFPEFYSECVHTGEAEKLLDRDRNRTISLQCSRPQAQDMF